jgi:hypothetical protein
MAEAAASTTSTKVPSSQTGLVTPIEAKKSATSEHVIPLALITLLQRQKPYLQTMEW